MAPKVRPDKTKTVSVEFGITPKTAPPKAEVSRKPPGGKLPKSKPSSETR